MSDPVKNVLIYADGRTREIEQPLLGSRFHVPETVDGETWERVFHVEIAYQNDPRKGPYTMIGVERTFAPCETKEQRAERRAYRPPVAMLKAIREVGHWPAEDALESAEDGL